MTRFKRGFGAAAILGLAAACGVATADDEMDTLKLEGGYTIVKGERDGAPIPAERIKGAIASFRKDEVRVTDNKKKDLYVAKFKLDVSKKPWTISMTTVAKKDLETGKTDKPRTDRVPEGETVSTTGLIKKDGDTIVLIYALPGGKTPTEFKTKEGDKTLLFYLKNFKQDGKKKKGGGSGEE